MSLLWNFGWFLGGFLPSKAKSVHPHVSVIFRSLDQWLSLRNNNSDTHLSKHHWWMIQLFQVAPLSQSCTGSQRHVYQQEGGRGTSPGHMISHQHQDDTLYWNTGILGHFQLTSFHSFPFLGRSLSILTPAYSITLISCFPQSHSMVLIICHLQIRFYDSFSWYCVCVLRHGTTTSNIAESVCMLFTSDIMNILGKSLHSSISVCDKPSYRKRKKRGIFRSDWQLTHPDIWTQLKIKLMTLMFYYFF